MNFAGHLTGGVMAGVVAGGACELIGLHYQIALMAGGMALGGALFPDLDISSIPQRWFGRIGAAVSSVLIGYGNMINDHRFVMAAAVIGLLALLMMAFKHRGPAHKYWLPLVLVMLAVFGRFPSPLAGPLMMAFAGGVCVHLVLDSIFPWSLKGWI